MNRWRELGKRESRREKSSGFKTLNSIRRIPYNRTPKQISIPILRDGTGTTPSSKLSNRNTDRAIDMDEIELFQRELQSDSSTICLLSSRYIKVKLTTHMPTLAIDAPKIPKRGERRRTRATLVNTFAIPILAKALVFAIAFKADMRI